MLLGMIPMICFEFFRDFWRKKLQKSKQEILGIWAPTPQHMEPMPLRSPTPQCGMPSCSEAEGAKIEILRYATA